MEGVHVSLRCVKAEKRYSFLKLFTGEGCLQPLHRRFHNLSKDVGLRNAHGPGDVEGVVAAFDNLQFPGSRQFAQDGLHLPQIAQAVSRPGEKEHRDFDPV